MKAHAPLEELVQALIQENYQIDINKDGSVKLTPVQIIEKKSLHIPPVDAIQKVENIARRHGIQMERQKRRRKEELPFPNLPPDSDKNRRDVNFQARVSPEFAKTVKDFCANTGMQKKDLTQLAIQQYMDNHTPE